MDEEFTVVDSDVEYSYQERFGAFVVILECLLGESAAGFTGEKVSQETTLDKIN